MTKQNPVIARFEAAEVIPPPDNPIVVELRLQIATLEALVAENKADIEILKESTRGSLKSGVQ